MKLFLRSFALAIGLFLVSTLYLSAQVDRTFWFVAPDASKSHSNEDQYIKLRLTNVSAVAATVTISMPKNSTFATQTIVINPGVQSTVTLNKADVENGTDGNRTTDLPVMNKGLLIESTQDITAYYEVGDMNNPDKFTLKGNSALGTEFYVPSNLDYRNYPLTIKAKEKIDIVATEDTKVTITPTTDCVGGRKAGESFDIDLKRGETYCLEAVGEDAKINLGGTHIVSTGKIAVTISDDSINLEPQGNYDIIGDQLIPVDVIGDKYVAIKTNDSSFGNIQKVYLTAVRDNSVIWYGTEKITLNKGQSVSRDIAKDNVYIYSEIGVPFYAYQVTGYGYEMGSAILPPITCTGSKQVDFNRSFVKDFWIQILAKDTDIGSFKLMDISQNKDKSSLLPAQSDWDIVYDKNGMDTKWRTVAVKSEAIDTNKPHTGISTGTTYRISNSTGKFHFSVLDQNGASLNYGYFSAYNSIRVSDPQSFCKSNGTLNISTSATYPEYNIRWYLASTDGTPIATNVSEIVAKQTGVYWVVATEKITSGCENKASTQVKILGADVQLPKDTTVCAEANYTLEGTVGTTPYTYLWTYQNSGSSIVNTATTQDLDLTVSAGTTTTVILTVTDENKCAVKDTINVTAHPIPALNLSKNPSSICIGQKISTDAVLDRYQWYLNGVALKDSIQSSIYPKVSGVYQLTGWAENDCSVTEQLSITVNSLPVISLSDKTECHGSSEVYSGPSGMASYAWTVGSSTFATSQITLAQPASSIELSVVDNNGCRAQAKASYSWYPKAPTLAGQTICSGGSVVLASDPAYTNYSWSFKQTSASTSVSLPLDVTQPHQQALNNVMRGLNDGIYSISAFDGNGCPVNQTIGLVVHPMPVIDLGITNASFCPGSTVTLQTNTVYHSYAWTIGSDPAVISTTHSVVASTAGTYTLTATTGADGCKQQGSVTVTALQNPIVTLSGSNISACENQQVVVNAAAANGSGSPYVYRWYDSSHQVIDYDSQLTRTDAGSFYVVVTDKASCTGTATVDITRNPLPVFSLRDATECHGEPYSFDGPVGMKTYLWQDGSGNQTLTLNQPVSEVRLTVTDNNNCTSEATGSLKWHAEQPTKLSDRITCPGTDIVLSTDPTYTDIRWSFQKAPSVVPVALATTGYQHTVTAAVNGVNDGNYIIEAKDVNKCPVKQTILLEVEYIPELDLGDDNITKCEGAFITLKSNYEFDSYEWEWTDGASVKSLPSRNFAIVEKSGAYSLTVYDTGKKLICFKTKSVNVISLENPEIKLSTDTSKPFCFSIPVTVTATANEVGGANLFKWYDAAGAEVDGDGDAELTRTDSGDFYVVATATNNCTDTSRISIERYARMADVILPDITECYGSSEEFKGLDGMVSYTWRDGSGGSLLGSGQTFFADRQYEQLVLDVVDSDGCTNSGIGRYAWWDSQSASLPDQSICYGGKIVLSTAPGYLNYRWSFQQTSSSSTVALPLIQTMPYQQMVTNSMPGINDGIYTILAQDEHGCDVNQTIKLTIDPVQTLDLSSSPRSFCAGSSVILHCEDVYDSYQWYKDSDPTVISSAHEVEVTQAGRYHLRVKEASDGCRLDGYIDVVSYQNPTVAFAQSTIPACQDVMVSVIPDVVQGSGNVIHYEWYDSNDVVIDSDHELSRTDAGEFKVVVRDNYGCTDSTTVLITRYPETTFTLNNVSICDNSTATLQKPSSVLANSYVWHNSDNTISISNADLVVNAKGVYTLDIVDPNACHASATLNLTHRTSPKFDLGAEEQHRCAGEVIEVKALSHFGSYYWNDDSSEGQPHSYTIIGNDQVQTIKLRIESSINDCYAEEAITVHAHSLPEVNLGEDITVCSGVLTPLSAPSGVSSILWSTPDGETDAPSIVAKSGTYKLSVTNAYSCQNSDILNIFWLPLPEVDLGPDELVCPITDVVLNASSGVVYQWEPSGSSAQSIVAQKDTLITLRVQDVNGCFGWDTKMIYTRIAPEYSLVSEVTICANDSIEFNAYPEEIFENYPTFTWSDGDTEQYKWMQETGEYWVEVTDGCFILRDTTNLLHHSMPVIAQLDTMIYQQIAVLPSGGTEPYVYAINDDEFQKDNVFRDLPNGEYVLWVRDGNMCLDSDTVSIFNILDLKIPNLITPNGDGHNDRWTITGLEKFPDSNIRIYDRYGKLLRIYKPTDAGWDGYYLNKPMPSDDYWYVVELNPTSKVIKGHMTLKR
ncbi:gliding motility-associated-like protein [Breznakibacter xylanolyticus]|uniref:Gliding motility-associated-like protein n=1 Tax=Breznakibacter xylanolyticus TaxID=990 RepID=A0A2W7P5A7_9BACT|nr:T9SS type B sorting domain-containing protein [Breznakibacter xylanolyticus]PZX18592.1 gliding motility-associated-like protein [Breznakibacter xylanolyticus]